MKTVAILFVLILSGCASRAYVEEDQASWETCKNLLLQQAEAWNRGELEVFVLGYRKSPQTIFMSDDEVRVGFEDMLARYEESYPDKASMGNLSFADFHFLNIDADHVMGTGTWILDLGKEKERWGRFGLIFRRENASWQIAVDYTTKGTGTRPKGDPEPTAGKVEDNRNIDPVLQSERSQAKESLVEKSQSGESGSTDTGK